MHNPDSSTRGADERGVVALPSDQEASGRSLGDEELDLLRQVIESGTLTSTKGRFVPELEARFAERYGVRHAIACSSGTAAVHAAVAAVDPEPGDEIVTTPITDMGAIAPILYQGAVPVFADVDPVTCNVTAATIADRLGDRTRAIVVTHLFGNPCVMEPIQELADARGIPVIEDCAQAFLSERSGRLVGTFGAIGCFSLQQGKHITTGEGGLVVTDDDAVARHVRLFVNKAWGYGDPKPDHYFLALNSRLTELQGAVALAQLDKLEDGVARRIQAAALLTELLADVPGISTPAVAPGDVHAFWRYLVRADGGNVTALAAALAAQGVASAPRYIQKPAFECEVIADQRTFGKSRFPFSLARPEAVDYSRELFPGTYAALEGALVLPFNERYTEVHVRRVAAAIAEAVAELAEVPA